MIDVHYCLIIFCIIDKSTRESDVSSFSNNGLLIYIWAGLKIYPFLFYECKIVAIATR